MSLSTRTLIGLIGFAILAFAGIVLNFSLERDTLTCDPSRCVADCERVLALGGPSGPREFRPKDVKRFELMTAQMRYGSIWIIEIEGQDDIVLRLVMDETQAYDLRRWFPDPSGRVAFEGPRSARNYPFVAILLGLAVGAFIVGFYKPKPEPKSETSPESSPESS